MKRGSEEIGQGVRGALTKQDMWHGAATLGDSRAELELSTEDEPNSALRRRCVTVCVGSIGRNWYTPA